MIVFGRMDTNYTMDNKTITVMKKKEIMIELVNDIPTLIRLQELSVIEMRKTIRNQQIIDFQEDVLRVLKAVNKMDLINLDGN